MRMSSIGGESLRGLRRGLGNCRWTMTHEALRTHLRLALTLSTIRDPIPETLCLQPDEEEMEVTEEWGDDVFERYDEWEDCWAVLAEEAEELATDVGRIWVLGIWVWVWVCWRCR